MLDYHDATQVACELDSGLAVDTETTREFSPS